MSAVPTSVPHLHRESFLRSLGLIGMESIEPIVIASLATESPLLLIGPHGTAKSLLLLRLSEALGIAMRHYNASLLNYDDLVGYPLPDADGKLKFVQTPASIWDAEAVFLDEISRCRPDMQNRLFSIVHEKRVQGLSIPKLKHRWSAMNPPMMQDDAPSEGSYLGSEPLDSALADRFNFVIEIPHWMQMPDRDREAIIRGAIEPVTASAAEALREHVAAVKAELGIVDSVLGGIVALYVRLISDAARQLGLTLSGRRAAMLYRNILATHAANAVASPSSDPGDSAWQALEHSLPHRAEGLKIPTQKLFLAHRQAWKAVQMKRTDPRSFLVLETDPVKRALRAMRMSELSGTELSAYIADGLAESSLGGRHALALHVMTSPIVDQLHAAIAEQAADLQAIAVLAQDVLQNLISGSALHQAWQAIEKKLARLKREDPETILLSNVLTGLFSKGDIASANDVDLVVKSWRDTRRLCATSPHLIMEAA